MNILYSSEYKALENSHACSSIVPRVMAVDTKTFTAIAMEYANMSQLEKKKKTDEKEKN